MKTLAQSLVEFFEEQGAAVDRGSVRFSGTINIRELEQHLEQWIITGSQEYAEEHGTTLEKLVGRLTQDG